MNIRHLYTTDICRESLQYWRKYPPVLRALFIIQQPDIRVERIKDIKLFSIGIGLTIVHALQVGALIKQVILKQDGFPDTHIALTG